MLCPRCFGTRHQVQRFEEITKEQYERVKKEQQCAKVKAIEYTRKVDDGVPLCGIILGMGMRCYESNPPGAAKTQKKPPFNLKVGTRSHPISSQADSLC